MFFLTHLALVSYFFPAFLFLFFSLGTLAEGGELLTERATATKMNFATSGEDDDDEARPQKFLEAPPVVCSQHRFFFSFSPSLFVFFLFERGLENHGPIRGHKKERRRGENGGTTRRHPENFRAYFFVGEEEGEKKEEGQVAKK